jgi:ubiquinone/menaquinone biosynthesis C-methylase UbiE
MSLRHSYRLLAPFYDLAIARFTARLRRESLAHLPQHPGLRVLVNGSGTGLDLPHLPPGNDYVALDLTRAMLERSRPRAAALPAALVQGDSHRLPFPDGAFDAVVLHLIVAVVPDATRVLAEAARVVRPGGRVLVLDKFLRPGRRAPLRRALTPLMARLATRLDVVFEHVLAQVPALVVESDEPAALGGWFRRIVLRRIAG